MFTTKLSILLYGDFSWDRLASSYERAFKQLGHHVVSFDTRDLNTYIAPWLQDRFIHRLTIRSLALRRAGTQRWNRRLVAVAQQIHPDIVFILNGEFLMPETLHALRMIGIKVFVFHADNPFPPHYNNRPETLPCAVQTDCYFIWSRTLVARLYRIGVERAEYLTFGWDAEIFPYTAPGRTFEHDVIFIGGWDKDREQFLTPLADSVPLKIWGPPYWATRTRPRSSLRHCWQGKVVTGVEAARLLTNSKIALNILRQQNYPDGVIMRTFEVPGAGGFMLSTRTQGALDIFSEGQAGAYFADQSECIQQIEALLDQHQQRQELAHKAHEIVHYNHQYMHKAQQVVDVYRALS